MADQTYPNPEATAGPKPASTWTGAAALNVTAIIMLGLYFGRALAVPVVLSVLLAFVLAPLVRVLQRAHLGPVVPVLLAVALAFGILGGIGMVVADQVSSLVAQLSRYQATIDVKIHSFAVGGQTLERLAAATERLLSGEVAPSGGAIPGPVVPTAPSAASPSTIGVVRTVLEPLLAPVATATLTVIFTIFVLMFREDLRDRLVRLVGSRELYRTITALNEVARRLSRYFLTQLGLAVAYGTYAATALWLVGLPTPFLWGLLAATMRFVPFIGGPIAVGAPVLLGLAVSPDWTTGLAALAIMLGGQLVMGQVVEPVVYGHSTGLSPIAVVLSTVFWALLWGPIGLLIAMPLTVCLVVVGRHVPALSFVHVILGDSSPLEPKDRFYQRALEGRHVELAREVLGKLGHTGLAEYFDAVAIPGLEVAQFDLSREALEFERLEVLHADVAAMLTALARSKLVAPLPAASGLPEDWRTKGAILCVPGRGPLDDLVADMAAQALRARGFGAAVLPNSTITSRTRKVADAGQVRLCCLSTLHGGSSAASIQFFLRRLERALPGAALVVGLWRATGDSTILAALRSDGGHEMIVLSLSELIALAGALAMRGPAVPRPVAPA